MVQPGNARRWFLGVAGLSLGPSLLLLDTQFAQLRGWQHQSADAIRGIQILTGISIAIIVFAALLPGVRPWLRLQGHRIGLFGVSLILGVVLGEGMLALVDPQPDFHLRPPNQLYTFHPDPIALRGITGTAEYRTNALGMRGPETSATAEYRILCLGGSTTECAYLDDSETWPALLGDRLATRWDENVWVGTAAVSEYASGHHLRFLQESSTLKGVDCVVCMPGANDLLRVFFELDAGTAVPPYWYRSHLLGLIREIWNVRLGHGMILDDTGEQLRTRRLGPGDNPASSTPPSQDPRSYAFRKRDIDFDEHVRGYEQRLTRLAETARARKLQLVFVTQPVLWEDFLDAVGQNKLLFARVYPYPRTWEFLNATELRKVMQKYNDAVRRVGKATNTTVVDAALDMNGRQEYFYDDFHLNEKGCQQIADLIANQLEKSASTAPGH